MITENTLHSAQSRARAGDRYINIRVFHNARGDVQFSREPLLGFGNAIRLDDDEMAEMMVMSISEFEAFLDRFDLDYSVAVDADF